MTTAVVNQHSWQTEDKRFYQLLWLGLLLWLVFAVLVPALQVPERSREVQEQLPPTLARVMLEQKQIPPPPEPEPLPEQKAEPLPEPETKPEPEPEAKPAEQPARERGASRGRATTPVGWGTEKLK